METNFAKLIRDTRRRLGLTQANFGFLIGVKRATVANYEAGNIKPSADVLVKVQELDRQNKNKAA